MGVLVTSQARATLVAEWQFNSYAGGNLSNFAPDYGSQAGSATATTTKSATQSFSKITGTTLNENTSSSPNYALQENGAGGPNATLTLHISGTGLSGFVLTYASESTAANTQSWAYSINNSSYTTFTSPSVGTSWGTVTVDFSSITSLNGAANVYFRDTITAASGTVGFDNIAINAVPEPVSMALAVFGGVAGLGLCVGALRKKLAKAAQPAE